MTLEFNAYKSGVADKIYRDQWGYNGVNRKHESWGVRDRLNEGLEKYYGSGVPYFAAAEMDLMHLRATAPLTYSSRLATTNYVPFAGPAASSWACARTSAPDRSPTQLGWEQCAARDPGNATQIGRHGYEETKIAQTARAYYAGVPPSATFTPRHAFKREIFSHDATLRGKTAQTGYLRQVKPGEDFRRRPYYSLPTPLTDPGTSDSIATPIRDIAMDHYGPVLDKPVRGANVYYLPRHDPWAQGGINSFTPSVDSSQAQRFY